MDPLQWMGAVRMRVQTADKYITIIHKQSTQLQYISFCKKQIHQDIFNLKPLLLAWVLYQ